MGCEESGFQLKEKEKEGVVRKTEGENEKTFLLLTLLH